MLDLIILTLLFTSSLAHADVLLIVADSQGMFGSDSSSQVMEHFGAEFVARGIGGNYRKVYRWHFEDGIDFSDVWNQLMSERQKDEPIDLFAMEHGPDPKVLDNLYGTNDAPVGSIRHFFSTACSNWGDFTANPDGSNAVAQANGLLIENMIQEQVKEFVLYANMNGTGLVQIPFLLSEMRKGGSWISATVNATRLSDDVTAQVVMTAPDFENSQLGRYFLGYASDHTGSDLGGWTDLIIARPTLGGFGLGRDAELQPLSMYNWSESGLDSFILKPSATLAQAQTQECPLVYDGSDGADCLNDPSAKGSNLTATRVLGNLFYELFKASSFGADQSQAADFCVDTSAIQIVVNAYLKTKDGVSPPMTSLCFSRQGDNDVRMHWRLGPTPTAQLLIEIGQDEESVASHDFWVIPAEQLDLGSDGFTVTGLTLAREGELRIQTTGSLAKISLDGMTFDLDLPGVPKFFSHDVGIDSFQITDSDGFILKLSAPLLNIPVNTSGNLQSTDLKLKILGIPFTLQ